MRTSKRHRPAVSELPQMLCTPCELAGDDASDVRRLIAMGERGFVPMVRISTRTVRFEAKERALAEAAVTVTTGTLPPLLIDRKGVQRVLAITGRMLDRLVKAGHLAPVRLGRRLVRFRVDDVQQISRYGTNDRFVRRFGI